MTLVSFTVENYRSFAEATLIELRPLTLVFGYNSAGKSALLRALPLLADSIRPGSPSPIALDCPAVRGAGFRDILCKRSASNVVRFGLNWSTQEGGASATLSVRDLPDRRRQIVEALEFESKGDEKPISLRLRWSAALGDDTTLNSTYEAMLDDRDIGECKVAFDGLIPHVLEGPPVVRKHLQSLEPSLREVADAVYWLGSFRATPPRTVALRARPRRILPDGTHAGDYLAFDLQDSGLLVQEASRWFQMATGSQLEVRLDVGHGGEQYSLGILPSPGPTTGDPFFVPIADTGEGLAQVLPVAVLGAMASLGHLGPDPTLLLEHPELHLHPGAHERLAALLCELASQHRATIVVETHSENVLLRVQRCIASGELKPDDAIIHWVRMREDGLAACDTLSFDERGAPNGWPPGVFAERTRQARALLKLRTTMAEE